MAAGKFPHDRIAGKTRLGLVNRHATGLLQQVIGAGIAGQGQIGLAHRPVQRRQCGRLGLIVLGRGHKFHQPGRSLRGVANPHRQRPQRVEQPARHPLPDAGQRHRRHAVARDCAGIAEAGHRPRLLCIDQRHPEPVALQIGSGTDADNPGADYCYMAFGLIGHRDGSIQLEHCAQPKGRRHSPRNLTCPPFVCEEMPWPGN